MPQSKNVCFIITWEGLGWVTKTLCTLTLSLWNNNLGYQGILELSTRPICMELGMNRTLHKSNQMTSTKYNNKMLNLAFDSIWKLTLHLCLGTTKWVTLCFRYCVDYPGIFSGRLIQPTRLLLLSSTSIAISAVVCSYYCEEYTAPY
jgi:hypothetical protein